MGEAVPCEKMYSKKGEAGSETDGWNQTLTANGPAEPYGAGCSSIRAVRWGERFFARFRAFRDKGMGRH